MAEFVEIFEMGPRDGLQNEKRMIPTGEKIALVDLLSRAGFKRIEVASFVSPKWVPQMADSGAVLAGIARVPGVRYAALTPNMKGFEGAVAAGADEIAVFGSASEGFSKANINATIAESIERFNPVIEAAKEIGLPVRGYISCVTDCPYDGPTDPASVAYVADLLWKKGCYEISLGDTIGQGRPETIDAMLPPVVIGAALLSLFARRGLIGRYLEAWWHWTPTYTFAGVVIAQLVVAMPFLVISVEAALRARDRDAEEAAYTLGAGRMQTFLRVVVPQIRSGIVAGAVMCFARALGEFGATVTFAGNVSGVTQTLPLAIYLQLQRDDDAAIAMAVGLLVMSLLVLVAMRGRWIPALTA